MTIRPWWSTGMAVLLDSTVHALPLHQPAYSRNRLTSIGLVARHRALQIRYCLVGEPDQRR